MKKLAAVVIGLFFASSAYAQVIFDETTNARMDGLGVANYQIDDDFNIFINPAQVRNYRNAVYGELGEATDLGGESTDVMNGWGGLHTGTSYGTWAFYLGRPYHDPIFEYTGVGSGIDANRLDLFYGSAGVPVGVYLGYANRSDDSSDEEATEYNLGVGGIFMDGVLEGAIDIAFGNVEDGVDEDMFGVALLGRHHADAGAAGTLISTTHIEFMQFDESDIDVLKLGINTALNSMPNNNTLLVTGIGIEYENAENGTEETTIILPVNIGVEHQTFKRVETRFGVRKALYDSFDNGSDTIVSDGYATVSVGLGVEVTDNLVVDWVVNEDVLFSGTYLVSGSNENLSSKVSASWRFE